MAGKYSIEAVFNLIDNITGPIDRISGNTNALGNTIQRRFLEANQKVDNFGKTVDRAAGAMKKVGIAAVAAGAAAATAFTVKGIRNAMNFNNELEKIGARANLTTDQLNKMSGELLKFSNYTGDSVSSLKKAQLKIIESGIAAADSVDFMKVAVKAATGGLADTSKVITGLTSVMKAYGLEASSATQISDQMMAAARAGGVSFGDMASKIERVLPVAAQFGVSTDELFASVASLTSQGVPLRYTVRQIESVLKRGGSAGLFDLAGGENFNDILKQVTHSAGATEEAFNRMNNTTQSNWSSLFNKVRNTGLRLGKTLMPVFDKIIDKLHIFADRFAELDFTSFAENVSANVDRIFDSIDFDRLAQGIGNFFNFVTKAASAVISFAGFIWKLRVPIIAVAGAIAFFKGALIATAVLAKAYSGVKAVLVGASYAHLIVVQKQTRALPFLAAETHAVKLATTAWSVALKAWGGVKYAAALVALNPKLAAVTAAKKIAAAAQWVWNAAMKANPIGKVIIIITLLIAILRELKNHWDLVVETFRTDGIIAGIKKLVRVIVSGLLAPIQGLLNVMSKIPGIGSRIAPAAEKLSGIRNSLRGIDEPAEYLTQKKNTSPAGVTNNAAPSVSRVMPPAFSAPEQFSMPQTATANIAGRPAVRQAALLDLRSSAPVATQAASAASNVTRTVNSAIPSTGAATRAVMPPQAPRPIVIPVEYDFPEMVIPPNILRTIAIPVEWAFNAMLPPGVNTIAPPPGPVNASIRESLAPPVLPMTQAEQIIYSRTEHTENVNITVTPEEGVSARVTKKPKSPNVKATVSGDT